MYEEKEVCAFSKQMLEVRISWYGMRGWFVSMQPKKHKILTCCKLKRRRRYE